MDPATETSFLAKVVAEMSRLWRQAGPAMAGAYTLIGAVVAFTFLGYFLDRWLETSPWLLVIGVSAGLVVGLIQLARVATWKSPLK